MQPIKNVAVDLLNNIHSIGIPESLFPYRFRVMLTSELRCAYNIMYDLINIITHTSPAIN
jgi:hypothetical protein